MTEENESKGERIAKRIARAGVCSRRDAERMIAEGRVKLNGKVLESPAVTVGDDDEIHVDGTLLPKAESARLWRYHKPAGLVTSHRDTKGRRTVFEALPDTLPRVISIGRLDINTEGLLLLTNDGGLARTLELPSTGWVRRYRVRAFGNVSQEMLDKLSEGIEVDGINYGSIDAKLDKVQGKNAWMTLALREGKNREIKRVLEHLGLQVNRLIRLSFGPFQLGDLKSGDVEEIPQKVIREQMGRHMSKSSKRSRPKPRKAAQEKNKHAHRRRKP